MEKKLAVFLNKEGRQLVEAMCSEYCFLCIVKNDNTYHPLVVSEEYEFIVSGYSRIYTDALNAFCDEFVRDKYRSSMINGGSIEFLTNKLKENGTYETVFQIKDLRWMGLKCYRISGDGNSFLLGIKEFDKEMQERQRNNSVNEIVKAFSEEINIIYRVNVVTYEYEIILLDIEDSAYPVGFKSFLEMEEDYAKNVIVEEYVERLPGEGEHINKGWPDKIRINILKDFFDSHKTKLNGYYKEKNGRWLKLTVTPEINYSDEYPYAIYAISKCSDEIIEKSRNIVNKSAISKMYCLVATINKKDGIYDCIHSEDYPGITEGRGRLEDLVSVMKKQIFRDDFVLFEKLIGNNDTANSRIIECEYRIEDEDGKFHYHNAFSTYIDAPDGKSLLLLVQNVDERALNRANLKMLNEEYEKVKSILYALGESYFGIYYVDVVKGDFSILRQNEDVSDVFSEENGYEEAMEKYIRVFVGPEDRSMIRGFSSIENISDVLREEGKTIFCEYQRLFGSELRWIRLEYQVTKCVNGRPVSVIMAFKDIHKERETELRHKRELRDALISARLASEAKTRFLSNMSHDIRTPMNAIMGMTSIALTHMHDPDKVRGCLNNIEVSAGHLLRLINEVLDMSHIESGKISLKSEPFSMNELMDSVVFIMQQQFDVKNQSFSVDDAGLDVTNVYGDRVRIQQILLNILSNASKYTPKGGVITLSVRHETDECNKDKGRYVFVVTDTGKGMSENFIRKIFRPFEREERLEDEPVEGSGLGMAISKSIVDMMDGDIAIESCINKGSVVTVTLPLKYNQYANQRDDSSMTCEQDDVYTVLKDKKILVVDDNEINCDIACDYLEDMGVITDVAINGKEAFNIISSGEYFDAVLMDIRMPVMNGYEATCKIRELKSEYARNIPIIAMTANAFEEDIQMSKQMGMNDHISKPISAQLLYLALVKVLS